MQQKTKKCQKPAYQIPSPLRHSRPSQQFGIVGNAPALTAAIERAIRVAPIDLSVLVTGESGTGKEFFHRLYTVSVRAAMPNI